LFREVVTKRRQVQQRAEPALQLLLQKLALKSLVLLPLHLLYEFDHRYRCL
jgi:hypothetical protein